jgi:hypothetical protein
MAEEEDVPVVSMINPEYTGLEGGIAGIDWREFHWDLVVDDVNAYRTEALGAANGKSGEVLIH